MCLSFKKSPYPPRETRSHHTFTLVIISHHTLHTLHRLHSWAVRCLHTTHVVERACRIVWSSRATMAAWSKHGRSSPESKSCGAHGHRARRAHNNPARVFFFFFFFFEIWRGALRAWGANISHNFARRSHFSSCPPYHRSPKSSTTIRALFAVVIMCVQVHRRT